LKVKKEKNVGMKICCQQNLNDMKKVRTSHTISGISYLHIWQMKNKYIVPHLLHGFTDLVFTTYLIRALGY